MASPGAVLPGARPLSLWRSEDHLRAPFGDRLGPHTLERYVLEVTAFNRPNEWGERCKAHYGPDDRGARTWRRWRRAR